ncbi:MAG: hypothetical protein CL758_02450 [Chloroflexi bacterium]|nr:hypothetical protein [Chloroflexota bacterium]|tara:strand:+ start:30595 stop:31047 length:453 start_codon:yes stop_codon:yes gene_type:complete
MKLGHLVIKVKDITTMVKFYKNVLGLQVTEKIENKMIFMSASNDSSHELGLMSISKNANYPNKADTGLYHFAWQMDTFDSLKQLYSKLKKNKIPILGIGDHGISIGVYFNDPEKNEIEVYYELPKHKWPKTNIFNGKFPINLEECINNEN